VSTKLLLLPSILFVLTACGGAAAPAEAPLDLTDPAAYKAAVDHPYFPMTPGTVWVYEGLYEGRFRHDEVRVLDEPRLLWGIPCMGLREEQYLDGDLAQVTTEWFAEDRRGNVWKFGEESLEFDGPSFARSDDSWVVGEGDALPWMMISATPAVGEVYVGYRPDGQDVMEVETLHASVIVAAGVFADCLRILENPQDVEDQDIILYAADVGRVQEASDSGRIELVSVR